MVQVVIAVRDVKTENFRFPAFSVAVGAAIREFVDACGDDKSVMFRHPEDFQLYKLGTFDDRTGVITPCVVPEMLVAASDSKK
ncbi:MAG: nonstructural protein [Arizlama microvirus]|nr:MAG: nonstructural protein [Arizlama microvirus]